MIDFTEINNGEKWEQFARDFLEEQGFVIDSPPDRGADGGKDMLIIENIKGKLHRYQFRWLVSCKHFAKSGNSVNARNNEKNILERVKSFNADGFIGFYSTLASAGLNSRLQDLKKENEINDYHIYDNELIERQLLHKGYSKLLQRYFPSSYKEVAPIHNIYGDYIPLKCSACGKDLLKEMYSKKYTGLVGVVERYNNQGVRKIKQIYFACKGKCDREQRDKMYKKYKLTTSWKDLSDLVIPAEFMDYLLTTIKELNNQECQYNKKAFEKEQELIMAISQKVLRSMTDKERDRVIDLMNMKKI